MDAFAKLKQVLSLYILAYHDCYIGYGKGVKLLCDWLLTAEDIADLRLLTLTDRGLRKSARFSQLLAYDVQEIANYLKVDQGVVRAALMEAIIDEYHRKDWQP